MLAMQDKPGLIQEPIHPDRRTTTINQRNEEVNLLPTTQIIVPNIEILPSQMTKSQATMVNEATCSTNAVDSLNSNTNTNTNTIMNSMSALTNDSNNQILSSRPQSFHSNSSHNITVDTNNGPSSPPPSSPPTSIAATTTPSSMASTTMTTTNTNNTSLSTTINSSTTTTNCTARTAKRTANDYRFGKTIGEGSFSSVYIAQDIHTKKEVASK